MKAKQVLLEIDKDDRFLNYLLDVAIRQLSAHKIDPQSLTDLMNIIIVQRYGQEYATKEAVIVERVVTETIQAAHANLRTMGLE